MHVGRGGDGGGRKSRRYIHETFILSRRDPLIAADLLAMVYCWQYQIMLACS